jgi:hypothetical protein
MIGVTAHDLSLSVKLVVVLYNFFYISEVEVNIIGTAAVARV